MRIYVGQVGCRLNYSEMETLARTLAAAGHTLVEAPGDAHVVVFNTCAVTTDAARGSRKEIRRLHTEAPQAHIAVTGCWATLAPDEAAQLPGVRLVASNTQKELLPLLLEPWSADFDDPILLGRLHPDAAPTFAGTPNNGEPSTRRSRTRAFVKVQDGCNNRCTFCIVTIARGDSRSRPAGEIVAEVQAHAAAGVQEVVLTGVHLGAYGRERGASGGDLHALIETLLRDTEIPRLRLSSLEPWDIGDSFFTLWQRWPERLCPHLHLPLQAGTDTQLRAMARRCTTASFRRLITEARDAIPHLTVTTDLIAGFPGESERDFEAGLAFVEEMRFLDAHIFPFSARPGTVAATLPGGLSGDVRKARARRLLEVVDRTGEVERNRFVGTTRPVLWEGEGQPLIDEPGLLLWSGMTDNGLRVQTLAPRPLDLHGRTLPAMLAIGPGHIMDATLLPSATETPCDGALGNGASGNVVFDDVVLGNAATASAGDPAGVL